MEEVGPRALAKITRRLIPFLFGIYVIAYLDRVNVSFAQLQLEDDLGFSDTIFGLGAGIFSLGYVIFGVPSNLALARFGARRWLAAIMMVWGVLSASTMFIEGAAGFYVLRFLLGAAEAGFFPGIILYLTWWFPERERTRALALFLTAISAAYVIGGPVSGGLLELDGVLGLDGWQWLFLVEGLPAIGLGFYTLRFLDEGPAEAEWLEPDEREFLVREIAAEQAQMQSPGTGGIRDALLNGQVWLLAIIYFLILAAAFGLTFFVPDLVQERTGVQRLRGGRAVGGPVRHRDGGDARRGQARRPGHQQAAVHRGAGRGGGGGHRPDRVCPVAPAAHGRYLARGRRAPRRDPGVLGAADVVSHRRRRGGGHRAGGRDRQPRRVRRAGLHGRERGLDRRLRDAARGALLPRSWWPRS